MVADSELPYPFHLKENEIVDKIVEFATSHENPSKWHGQCFHFFKSNNAHPHQDFADSGNQGVINSIYHRTKDEAHKRIETLLEEINERQREEIIQHSRELAREASERGKKSVSFAQVRDFVNKLSPPLIVPDAKNVLYARANFVMKGLRE